jgi:copper transport protein
VRGRALALAGLLALLAPATASAHAVLESTTPARGAVVAREPAQVVFRFGEPVEGNFGAVRVYDVRGNRVDQGDAFHPGGRGPDLGVHLRPGLPDGTYTATYRVVSADGHIVSSGVTFSIGRAGSAGQTVQQLLGKRNAGSGPVSDTVFAASRAIQYGSTALLVGSMLFLLVCWLPALRLAGDGSAPWRSAAEAYSTRMRTVLLAVALAGAVSALAGVVLEAADAAGVTGWQALRPHILSEVLGTRFGTVWTISAGCWLVAGILGATATRRLRGAGAAPLDARTRALLGAAVAPLAFLVIAPSLAGHGLTQSPRGVLFPSIVVHVAAMSAWVGGLGALLLTVPAATRRLEGAGRTRLLSAVLARFSPLALGAVIVLLATGLVQSFFEIRHPSLILTTAFGRAALIKLVLLLGLIGLGAVNRQRTLPRLAAAARGLGAPGAIGVVLRRTLRGEAALLLVVLGTTGALASYAPAIARDQGPANLTAAVGPAALQMTVDPARAGANTIHLYLTDPRTGAQFTRFKELTVAATLPSKSIGPLPLDATVAGPGHYTIANAFLTSPGRWTLRVTMRTSEFDEFSRDVEVQVR